MRNSDNAATRQVSVADLNFIHTDNNMLDRSSGVPDLA
jgi:hypothetical protein